MEASTYINMFVHMTAISVNMRVCFASIEKYISQRRTVQMCEWKKLEVQKVQSSME